MARQQTSAQRAALSAKVKYVGLLVEIAYSPTPLRVWTGYGSIAWDSKTWAGIGDFGSMSAVTEKVGARADMMKLTLNGVPSDKIATAFAEGNKKREVNIYIATFSVSAGVWSVIDAPDIIAWGETDVHEIVENDPYCSIEVNVETPLARLAIINCLRYTLADHQRLFPEDLLFDAAEKVAEQVLYWPNIEPASASAAAANSSSTGNTEAFD